MINRQDIALDDEFALVSAGADFAEQDSTGTDAAIITLLQKGELRYAPWLGWGIKERLRGVANVTKATRELKVELENDGFVNPEVIINNADFSDLQIIV
jgi:hypothetical protein